MEVSDSHPVDSQLECPTREVTLYEESPMAPPCTVTLADPVDPGEFERRMVLAVPRSIDSVSVKLPVLSPAVIATLLVPAIP